MIIRNVFRFAIAAAAIAFASQDGRAAFISGSASFDFINAQTVPTAGNLDTASGFTFPTPASFNVNASRTGNYLTALTTGQSGTATPLNFTGTGVNSTLITPFVLDFGGSKTFTASSGSVIVRTFRDTGNFSAALFGTVAFAGFDPTPGLVTVAFTQTGGPNQALSGSGTLFSPVDAPRIATPLPPTLALGVFGMLGLGGLGGFRRLMGRA